MPTMVQSIEELSLNACPSLQTVLYDGWVLRFANGYTRRANSVNPLYPSTKEASEKIGLCERLYHNKGLKSVFKITPVNQSSELDSILKTSGYRFEGNTSVQLLNLNEWDGKLDPDITLYDGVTKEWFDAYRTMNGLDPKYHPTLLQLLELLVPAKRLAVLHDNGKVIACGLGILQGKFIGLFDIVVDKEARRQGYGKRLIESLLAWGKSEGAETSYLQVVAENEPALQLYAKLGFKEDYRYWYRVKE